MQFALMNHQHKITEMLKNRSLEKTGIEILNSDCSVIIAFNLIILNYTYIFSALNASK